MIVRPYVVIDACVFGAWTFNEPYSLAAIKVLDAIEDYRIYPVVPDRFTNEVLRICQKKYTSVNATVSAVSCWQQFQDTLSLSILLVPSDTLHQQAWNLSLTTGLTAHDALYLAVTQEWDAELWTLDDRLANVPRTVYKYIYDLRTDFSPC